MNEPTSVAAAQIRTGASGFITSGIAAVVGAVGGGLGLGAVAAARVSGGDTDTLEENLGEIVVVVGVGILGAVVGIGAAIALGLGALRAGAVPDTVLATYVVLIPCAVAVSPFVVVLGEMALPVAIFGAGVLG